MEPFTHTLTEQGREIDPRTGQVRVQIRCTAGDVDVLFAVRPEFVDALLVSIADAHARVLPVHTVPAGTCVEHGEQFTGRPDPNGGSDAPAD